MSTTINKNIYEPGQEGPAARYVAHLRKSRWLGARKICKQNNIKKFFPTKKRLKQDAA